MFSLLSRIDYVGQETSFKISTWSKGEGRKREKERHITWGQPLKYHELSANCFKGHPREYLYLTCSWGLQKWHGGRRSMDYFTDREQKGAIEYMGGVGQFMLRFPAIQEILKAHLLWISISFWLCRKVIGEWQGLSVAAIPCWLWPPTCTFYSNVPPHMQEGTG